MSFEFTLTQSRPQGFDRLHDWLGVWSMHEPQAVGLYRQVSKADLQLHIGEAKAAVAGPSRESDRLFYEVVDGIALITISGTMMKYSSSFGGGASTVIARKSIRAAMNDDSVKGILVVFDSPGGTVSGTPDLANDIAAARQKKPTWGYIEDLGASAAYWAVSQTEHIRINGNALVGSIGVFSVVEDESGLAESLRVKVHVIKAGEFKGAGVPGSVITEKQLAEWQRNVDAIYGQFIDAVAKGRGMDRAAVESLADGRVHMGAEAVRLGLADRVSSLDETLADLRTKASARTVTGSPGTKGSKAMSETTPNAAANASATPQPATLADLRECCEGATSDFMVSQLDAKATVPQAMKAWNKQLQADLKAANDKIVTESKRADAEKTRADAAEQKLANLPAKPAGVTPPPSSATTEDADASGNAKQQWDDAYAAEKKAGKTNAQATAAVIKANPGLRERMLAEVNTGNKRK